MKSNAVILAAGMGERMCPFTIEYPKGLIKVKGQTLIDRQIDQLINSGIENIVVVSGYLADDYFYLKEKYPKVILIENKDYDKFNNPISLILAEKYIKNTYICSCDNYYTINPFISDIQKAHYSLVIDCNLEGEYKALLDEKGVIIETGCDVKMSNLTLLGYAYFDEEFSLKFFELLKKEIDKEDINTNFWEYFWSKHLDKLKMKARMHTNKEVLEFDSINDLLQFDKNALKQNKSTILDNICQVFNCEKDMLSDFAVIKDGIANKKILFTLDNKRYMYKHPGKASKNYIEHMI